MAGRRLTADAPPPIVDQLPPGEELPDGTVVTESGETRLIVGDSVSSRITELSDKDRVDFSTLLTCGQISGELNVMDHAVAIENLDTLDYLMCGKFTKEYVGTDAYQWAHQLATVACGIRTVDGRPVYTAHTENATPQHHFDETVKRLRHFRPVVIVEIYHEICKLDVEFDELRTKLGKQNG